MVTGERGNGVIEEGEEKGGIFPLFSSPFDFRFAIACSLAFPPHGTTLTSQSGREKVRER